MTKYSKKSGSLWNYYRDEPSDPTTDSELFRFTASFTGSTPNKNSEEGKETSVPLKCLSNSWRTFKILLIQSEEKYNFNMV